jgi:methylated-DNA-[protein]-cysteine S-methyltransferase
MTPLDRKACYNSPLGPLTITEREGAVVALDWGEGVDQPHSEMIKRLFEELDAYFMGSLETFATPVLYEGSAFQKKALEAMSAIPYGETRTYGDLAHDTGMSAQAYGQACGANRIPILIPCHRVLGADGLGGYSGHGGIETKVALLKLEGAASLLI